MRSPSPAAALALQRAAGNRAATIALQRMAACPRHLADSDPTPPGWKPYHGNSSVFHCGFRGILEDRAPTPGDPMNECFYDHSGDLVDGSHRYAACGGTPDEYDSAAHPIKHTVLDSGGILQAGGPAFVESRAHDFNEAVTDPIVRWFDRGIRGIYGIP